MIGMTVRQSLACRAINVFAHRLHLRDEAQIAASKRRRGNEAWMRGDARPACPVEAAGWDETASYMAMRGVGSGGMSAKPTIANYIMAGITDLLARHGATKIAVVASNENPWKSLMLTGARVEIDVAIEGPAWKFDHIVAGDLYGASVNIPGFILAEMLAEPARRDDASFCLAALVIHD